MYFNIISSFNSKFQNEIQIRKILEEIESSKQVWLIIICGITIGVTLLINIYIRLRRINLHSPLPFASKRNSPNIYANKQRANEIQNGARNISMIYYAVATLPNSELFRAIPINLAILPKNRQLYSPIYQ